MKPPASTLKEYYFLCSGFAIKVNTLEDYKRLYSYLTECLDYEVKPIMESFEVVYFYLTEEDILKTTSNSEDIPEYCYTITINDIQKRK